MEGLVTFLIFAGLFYVMMRFGCGAHMIKGGHHGDKQEAENKSNVDPVCGIDVGVYEGYGKMHDEALYRFCSRECLDRFESEPEKFMQAQAPKGGLS